jgi:transcriptional regulator with GAF, ATPase, and Fis domain
VNCAAISETLIETEFFGHEKGAFTGATERREGRFELANGGTLLLDEISEITPRLQAKLLRVLQEQEFERVGGTKTIKVDVRVLATTNRDLKKAVEKGDFREDLYYRLHVFPVFVPPLRERTGDIERLANHFLERFARRHKLEIPGYSQAAMDRLLQHPWPGNVRELQNLVERAVILTENGTPVQSAALGLPPVGGSPAPAGPLEHLATNANHLPSPAAASEGTLEPPLPPAARESGPFTIRPLAEVEQEHILRVLQAVKGNRTHAANALGISIRTLRNRLNEFSAAAIAIPDEEES